MTHDVAIGARRQAGRNRRRIIIGLAVVAVIGAMALDTTVVRIGSEDAAQAQGFSPETYGVEQFPAIQASVEERAVPAQELAAAIAEDKTAAGEQYGVPAGGIGPVIPVTFTGIAGEEKSGVYTIAVDGLPEETQVRVQTGPAINGTDLRDATGEITFGQFTNQIEYQNAGAAINNAMKEAVLAGVDTENLSGQTVTVTGVFKLINPKNWLVTPVRLEVQ